MLVEPKFYRPSIAEKALNGLDAEITQALNSDIPDDQKAKLYEVAIRKFRGYSQPSVEKTQEAETKRATDLDTEVLESIAPNIRYKAKRLLNYIKRSADAKVDHNGELSYRQRHLPNSSIVDLIESALTKKTADQQPAGWEEFASILRDVGAPRALIDNDKIWRTINVQRKSSKLRHPSLVKASRKSTPSPAAKVRASRRGAKIGRGAADRWLEY